MAQTDIKSRLQNDERNKRIRELEERLEEAEKHRGELDVVKAKVAGKYQLEMDLTDAKIELEQMKKAKTLLEAELSSQKLELEEYKLSNAELATVKLELEQMKRTKAIINSKVELELTHLNGEIDNLKNDNQKLKIINQTLQTENAFLSRQKEDLISGQNLAKSQQEQYTSRQIDELRTTIKILQEKVDESEGNLMESETKRNDLRKQIDRLVRTELD